MPMVGAMVAAWSHRVPWRMISKLRQLASTKMERPRDGGREIERNQTASLVDDKSGHLKGLQLVRSMRNGEPVVFEAGKNACRRVELRTHRASSFRRSKDARAVQRLHCSS